MSSWLPTRKSRAESNPVVSSGAETGAEMPIVPTVAAADMASVSFRGVGAEIGPESRSDTIARLELEIHGREQQLSALRQFDSHPIWPQDYTSDDLEYLPQIDKLRAEVAALTRQIEILRSKN